MENILIVIEELGGLLSKYKDEIKYKNYEIDNLKKKIEQIENYIDFYSKEQEQENILIMFQIVKKWRKNDKSRTKGRSKERDIK